MASAPEGPHIPAVLVEVRLPRRLRLARRAVCVCIACGVMISSPRSVWRAVALRTAMLTRRITPAFAPG